MTSRFDHPLCAPRETMTARQATERLDPGAWHELAAALEPAAEIAALCEALEDATDVVDIGGGTVLIAQAIATHVPVTVIQLAAEQRAHLPPGIVVRAGRAPLRVGVAIGPSVPPIHCAVMVPARGARCSPARGR